MKKTVTKQPLQARSRSTVDAIVEASARILKRGGFESLNTNKIAEIAGVSVGSIYQFFKNKNSIVEELFLRVNTENMVKLFLVLDQIETDSESPLQQAIEGIVNILFETFEQRGASGELLFETLPAILGLKRISQQDESMIEQILLKLQQKHIALAPKDPEKALFVVVQSLRATTAMTFARNESDASKKRIQKELVQMCLRYLQPLPRD